MALSMLKTTTEPVEQKIVDEQGRPVNIYRITMVLENTDIFCLQGWIYFVKGDTVFLNNGCRVQLQVCYGSETPLPPSMPAIQSQFCDRIHLVSTPLRPALRTFTDVFGKPLAIISMTLVEQLSVSSCTIRKSFSLSGNEARATDGCQGVFNICYEGDMNLVNSTDIPTGPTCKHIILKSSAKQHVTKRILDDRMKHVNVTSFTIVKQISKVPCVERRNFYINASAVVVKHGCEAKFEVCYSGFNNVFPSPSPASPEPFCETLVLQGSGNSPLSKTFSDTKNGNAQVVSLDLVQQLSKSQCLEWINYYFEGNTVVAKGGCNAQFEVCYVDQVALIPPPSYIESSEPEQSCRYVILFSKRGRVAQKTIKGVRGEDVTIRKMTLVSQLSQAACVPDESFFFTEDLVVSSQGCGGTFRVCYDDLKNFTTPKGQICEMKVKLVSSLTLDDEKTFRDKKGKLLTITDMLLVEQLSEIQCVPGDSYSFSGSVFRSVDGCRGVFKGCFASNKDIMPTSTADPNKDILLKNSTASKKDILPTSSTDNIKFTMPTESIDDTLDALPKSSTDDIKDILPTNSTASKIDILPTNSTASKTDILPTSSSDDIKFTMPTDSIDDILDVLPNSSTDNIKDILPTNSTTSKKGILLKDSTIANKDSTPTSSSDANKDILLKNSTARTSSGPGQSCKSMKLMSQPSFPIKKTFTDVDGNPLAIRSVKLLEQFSTDLCSKGNNFKFTKFELQVVNGCRGNFQVCFQPESQVTSTIAPPVDDSQRCEMITLFSKRSRSTEEKFTDENMKPLTVRSMTLVEHLSEMECVQGDSYDFSRFVIFVTKGCGGSFYVCYDRYHKTATATQMPTHEECTTVTLHSSSSKSNVVQITDKNNNPVHVLTVEVVKQISDVPCVSRETFDYQGSGVRATDGCWADFKICYRKRTQRNNKDEECVKVTLNSSRDKPHAVEITDKSNKPVRVISVEVIRQFPIAPCLKWNTFEYAGNRVWAIKGCSADFNICYEKNSEL